MSKIRIAVIFGGVSSEHDISRVSAANVIQNLPQDKYEIISVGITKKGRWLYFPGDVSEIPTGEWEKNPDCTPAVLSPDTTHKGFIMLSGDDVTIRKVDVVFPVLHGKNGEDGTIQGLLELSGIPYVGCGVMASADGMDKATTHTVLDANGIRTAKYRSILQCDLSRLDEIAPEIADALGYPVFVKPANCGSSIGINKANDIEELKNAVKLAFTHDKKVIVEEFIEGQEIECAVFGNDSPIASCIGEIAPATDFYDYEAKYVLGSTNLYIPARIPEKSADEVREIAVKAFRAMGCSGLSRVDFFLKKDGGIILNEINTMPGFTAISMYPKLMEAIGVPYGQLLDKLVRLAFERADVTID